MSFEQITEAGYNKLILTIKVEFEYKMIRNENRIIVI